MRRPAPLALWLAIQITALAIGAARIPLAARAGTTPQHWALAELLTTQIVATTLLFPWLLQGVSGFAAAFTALPFIQLAALLTSTPAYASTAVSIQMLLWITGLTAWSAVLRSKGTQAIAIALLGGIVIGGPLLTYLVREFSEAADHATWHLPSLINPIASIVTQGSQSNVDLTLATAPLAIFLSGAFFFTLQNRRANLATSYPQSDSPTAHNYKSD